MFFVLSKLLFFLVTPIIWVFILLIWSLLSKNTKRKKKLLISALAVFYFFSNSFLLDEFSRWWETPPMIDAALETYDVAIVLGGYSSYNKVAQRVTFKESSDRIVQAMRLYKLGIVKKILLNGGTGSLSEPELREATFIHQFLVENGIPAEDILTEPESKNTHENAVFAKEILMQNFPDGKYLLITSGYHMPRAIGCFDKVGLSYTPYPVDHFSGKRKFLFDHMFIPNAGAMIVWQSFLREVIGYIVYKVVGYT